MTPVPEIPPEALRTSGGHVARPHPSVPGTPVRRTVTYGPWEVMDDGR